MISDKKYGLGIINPLSQIKVENNFSAPIIKTKSKTINKSKLIGTLIKNENRLDTLHYKNCKKTVIEIEGKKDLIIIEQTNKDNNAHHLLITGKENSEASIFLEIKGNSKISTLFVEIIAEKNSKINYYELNELKSGFIYAKRLAHTEENSEVNFLITENGAEKIFSETKTLLKGKNSSTTIKSLQFSNKQFSDIKLEAEHANKNTKSDLKSKSALKNSIAFIRGLVKINTDAEDSDGYQKTDTLILENSRAVSIPDLLIHNDKVRCSHGSTTSTLDEEKLFYMRSRGLTTEQASLELLEGFFEPELKDIKNPEILPRILSSILERVKQ